MPVEASMTRMLVRVVAGMALLMYNLDFFGAIDWGIVAAVSVIGIGAALIYASVRQRR